MRICAAYSYSGDLITDDTSEYRLLRRLYDAGYDEDEFFICWVHP